MVTITPIDEFSIESLLGPTLLKNSKKPAVSTAKEAFKHSKPSLIALYFSASWCPPCQRFTPVLIDFYNAAKASSKTLELEIVFVSSDRNVEEFEKYYAKMPWLAIPPAEGSAKVKTNLSNTLGVSAIPALAIIDAKTGEFISGGEARDDVMSFGGDPEKVKAIIEKWKEAERKPISEAPQLMDTGNGARNPLFKFLTFMAKNPMIIFGLIYFYQWMQRKMKEAGYDDDATTPPVVEASAEDGSEF